MSNDARLGLLAGVAAVLVVAVVYYQKGPATPPGQAQADVKTLPAGGKPATSGLPAANTPAAPTR